MSRKLAIIGANESILPLIMKAKELGFETHVFARRCGDPGESCADYFYPISIDEKENILEECRKIGICGVCSITSDFAAPIVSFIAREMGLIGNPESTDVLARNKYKMRCALKNAGLYTPRFYEVDKNVLLEELRDISYPLIVKPTDRWSSKGVSRVDSFDELMKAVEIAVDESFDNKAIIEEFMSGPEYSAECICYRGQYKILAFTKKQTTGYPHYIETGHIQPSDISFEKQEEIKQVIYKALNALNIQNGAAHAEFRILEDGTIGIIEIGARMGGDCIGTDLTPVSTGMDYIRMVIDIACGEKPCFDIVSQPSDVKIKFIIDSDDIREFETIKENASDSIIRVGKIDTDFDREVTDSSTRHGYYIVRC